MTKKKEYESKEYLIANYERIAAEMDAAHGPQIASPPRGRPRKGEVRTPMIGKTVKLPSAVCYPKGIVGSRRSGSVAERRAQ